MKEILIQTHRPKTAGSVFFRTCIEPNMSPEEIYRFIGIRALRNDNLTNTSAIIGHSNFGIHRYISRPCIYVTMLREPIDLAISFYYFILQEFETRNFEHTHLALAQKYSHCEFWEQPDVRNPQTRALNDRWQLMLPGSPFLSSAKKHLKKHYRFIGTFEDQDSFRRRFCDAMNWTYSPPKRYYTQTKQRIQVSDLSTEMRMQLEAALDKDLQLYSYAKEHLI